MIGIKSCDPKKVGRAIGMLAVVIVALIFILIYRSNQPDNFKIGSILILSGEGASWGESSRNGIDMAVQEINVEGGILGKKLEVIYEDDRGEPGTAIAAFRKLTGVNGANVIIGPTWSRTGIPLIKLADQKKVIMISPSLGLKDFNEGSKYLFNTWPHDSILSQNLAEYVYGKGFRSVALLGAKEIFVRDQTEAFKQKFELLGGKISILIEPNPSETDVRSHLIKMRNNKQIDAVVLATDGLNLTPIFGRQMKELNIVLPMFSISLDKKIISNCLGSCDGMRFLTFLTSTNEFESVYKTKYNREVEIGADSAYDAVMLIREAIIKTNSTDSDRIQNYLHSMNSYDGVSGHLISDGKGGFVKDYEVKEIVNGYPNPVYD